VLLPLDFLSQECALAGGSLRPVEQPVAWSLDVDGDVSNEILVDLRQNMDCQGAPGVFSCGSLGCPYFLYAKRGDGWVELAAINVDDAPAIAVLPAAGHSRDSARRLQRPAALQREDLLRMERQVLRAQLYRRSRLRR
jgi:hypothetical protein